MLAPRSTCATTRYMMSASTKGARRGQQTNKRTDSHDLKHADATKHECTSEHRHRNTSAHVLIVGSTRRPVVTTTSEEACVAGMSAGGCHRGGSPDPAARQMTSSKNITRECRGCDHHTCKVVARLLRFVPDRCACALAYHAHTHSCRFLQTYILFHVKSLFGRTRPTGEAPPPSGEGQEDDGSAETSWPMWMHIYEEECMMRKIGGRMTNGE